MKGKIIKVVLTNFMTYEHLELVPGPYMNVIVGPNGSGKSSILCSLCLGLGGKVTSTGRICKLSEYIKAGCNSATIELEVQAADKREAFISRTINKGGNDSGGSSIWALNGKTTNQKEVEKFVRGLNIDMDNLCQYLSQERVADFSKMNSKELLKNTEKSVGSTEMHADHLKLIDMCKNADSQDKSLNQLKLNFEKESGRLQTLQENLDKMKDRLAVVKELSDVRAKIPWVEYNEKVTLLEEVKKDTLAAKAKLDDKQKAIEPVEKALKELRESLKNLKDKLKRTSAGPTAVLVKYLEDQDKIQQEITKNVRSLKLLKERESKFQSELNIIEQKISSNREKLESLKSQFDPERQREKIQKFAKEIREYDGKLETETRRRTDLQNRMQDISNEIRSLDWEKNRQSSVAQKRMDALASTDRLAHSASQYLRNDLKNHPFHGNVFPSIMLEINVKDPRASMYVQAVISRRDKIALLCEYKEDFNNLFLTLKGRFGKGLNMLVQGKEPILMDHPVDLPTLRKMGFDDYLSNLIDCPPEIFNYLCKSYRIHQIPVAYRDGSVNEKTAMQHFTNFYIGANNYRVSTSRYSGEKSTRIGPVNSRINVFADSIDQSAIAKAEALKQEKEQERDAIQSEARDLNESIQDMTRKRETLRNNTKEIRTLEGQINGLQTQVSKNEASKKQMIDSSDNFDRDRQTLLNLNKKHFKTLTSNVPNFKNHIKKCYLYSHEVSFMTIETKAMTRKVSDKELELSDKKRARDDFKRTVDQAESRLMRFKDEAKEMKKIAIKAAGCQPGQPAFDEFRKRIATFPERVQELEDKITELSGRLELMDEGNENVAELLEAQKKKCASLQKQLRELEILVNTRKETMDALKGKWLPNLEELADRISVKFERLCNYMGCEGEVKLSKGTEGVEDDFENYGLMIKIGFRSGQKLEELGLTQSGGERSVSTAIYLLSLQELTDVPFRCMDEINQGMDKINEKRILELMMKMSSNADSCQYFVVSPKMLLNLNYAHSCRFLCVQTPMRMDTSQWTMAKFLCAQQNAVGEKRSRSSQDDEEEENDETLAN